MRAIACACTATVVAFAALAGCGGGADATPIGTASADAAVLGMPMNPAGGFGATAAGGGATGATLGGGASAGGGVTAPFGGTTGGIAPSVDAGIAVALPDAAAGSSLDASAPKDGGPPVVLQLPGSSIDCGGSPCDTLSKVCCESWSASTGFSGQRMCVTRDVCNQTYSRSDPESNRVVAYVCDGKEDCSGGQVCCFYADGRPLCSLDDILDCTTKVTGPGGSTVCAEESKCKLGSTDFIAEGVPLGVLACNDDGDCAARAGTHCQPEQSDTITTGKGVAARSYIKVCQ